MPLQMLISGNFTLHYIPVHQCSLPEVLDWCLPCNTEALGKRARPRWSQTSTSLLPLLLLLGSGDQQQALYGGHCSRPEEEEQRMGSQSAGPALNLALKKKKKII